MAWRLPIRPDGLNIIFTGGDGMGEIFRQLRGKLQTIA
jgi:hypothetical protein